MAESLDVISVPSANMYYQKRFNFLTAGLGVANAAKALNDGTIDTQITKNGTQGYR